jgi:mannosyltransferase
MKIVFDNIIFSLQHVGGISVFWQELTSRFLSSGDDVTFLEYKGASNNIFRSLIHIPSKQIQKIKTCCLNLTRYKNPVAKIDKPFIFHSSYYRFCSSRNAINVCTVHDFTYDYFFRGKKKFAFVHIWQRNRTIRHSDAVVCISENTRLDLIKFIPNIDTSKLYVINNGVSSEYKQLPPESKILELSDWILFVGQRASYKNGRFLVDSIIDTSYKVIFCGAPLSEDEILYLDRYLGRERYKSVSGLSNAEMNRYYNSCKCLVYPSSYEGFGIPVLEAQAAGCPVIAYNCSSIPEVIGGNKMLLMNSLTREELLQKLSLLDDVEVRTSVIKSGLDNVRKYSWNKIYEQYRNLYDALFVRMTNQ